MSNIISLREVPKGLKQIQEIYGVPDADVDGKADPAWFKENITLKSLKYPIRYAYDSTVFITTVQAHVKVIDSLVDALDAISESPDSEKLKKDGYWFYGGAYFFRPQRENPALSTHAWGIAVDIAPAKGRLGDTEAAKLYPSTIYTAFEARGWTWGGRWKTPWKPDAMHFQACIGY